MGVVRRVHAAQVQQRRPVAHPADDFNGHVPNTVTSLLAAYRGYDTMFETAVIFTAAMSLILLLRRRREDDQGHATLEDQVILRVMC